MHRFCPLCLYHLNMCVFFASLFCVCLTTFFEHYYDPSYIYVSFQIYFYLSFHFQCVAIIVPTATILGGPDDLYVDKGSSINLTCLIRFSPEPPNYIFWYHQNEVCYTTTTFKNRWIFFVMFCTFLMMWWWLRTIYEILISIFISSSYIHLQVLSEETRNNIRIHFEQQDNAAISYLLIRKADFTDSGTYKCDPANAEIVSIRVNVLNGKYEFLYLACTHKENIWMDYKLNLHFEWKSLVQGKWEINQNIWLNLKRFIWIKWYLLWITLFNLLF